MSRKRPAETASWQQPLLKKGSTNNDVLTMQLLLHLGIFPLVAMIQDYVALGRVRTQNGCERWSLQDNEELCMPMPCLEQDAFVKTLTRWCSHFMGSPYTMAEWISPYNEKSKAIQLGPSDSPMFLFTYGRPLHIVFQDKSGVALMGIDQTCTMIPAKLKVSIRKTESHKSKSVMIVVSV